jgi:mRNA interferase RelE/StbE
VTNEAIDGLAEAPQPPGMRKLTGTEQTWRIRIGDYRVIYDLYDEELVVLVLRVAHRKDAY